MLKLIKYEIKATARTFIPLYGGLFILSVFMRLFLRTDISDRFTGTPGFIVSLIFGIVGLLYSLILSAVFILTAFVMIQRFYKNLLGDEGYLMFTLPVATWKHIASKTVVSAMWVAVSFIDVLISSFLMTMTMGDVHAIFLFFPDFSEFIRQDAAFSVFIAMAGVMLFLLLCLLCGILAIYASISLGQLWSRHKIFGSFLSFMGIWTGIVIVIAVVVNISLSGDFYVMFSGQAAMHLVITMLNIFAGAVAAVCFFLTHYILSRKLNLE